MKRSPHDHIAYAMSVKGTQTLCCTVLKSIWARSDSTKQSRLRGWKVHDRSPLQSENASRHSMFDTLSSIFCMMLIGNVGGTNVRRS